MNSLQRACPILALMLLKNFRYFGTVISISMTFLARAINRRTPLMLGFVPLLRALSIQQQEQVGVLETIHHGVSRVFQEATKI
jgi:hypothetical protein